MTGRGAVLTHPIVYGGTEHVLDVVPMSSEPASLQQPRCFSHLGYLLANLSFVVRRQGSFTTLQPSPAHFMFSGVANVLSRVCVPCVLGIGDANTALFHLDNVKLFVLSMPLGIKHLPEGSQVANSVLASRILHLHHREPRATEVASESSAY